MPILQRHYDEIKSEFERDEGGLFSWHLNKKKGLIKDHLPNSTHLESIGFKATSFHWYEFTHTATEREDVFVIDASFLVTGNLIVYEHYKESSKKETTLDVTVRVLCTYYPEWNNIVYIREDFEVMVGELKKIHSFDEVILREFNKLTMLKTLTTALFDKTWPYNEEGNKTHVFISSLNYYYELENMNRQARYFIALANTYNRYANDYFPDARTEPIVHYPLNFTSHDRRYLDYCSSAIQSMYIYWERIALLIYQYYKPKDQKKVNDSNLSFAKLIKEIIKEQKNNNIDLSWFADFLKKDHTKLQLRRHPLVHFKVDPTGPKGSYIPMIHTKWINNIGDMAQLEEIENFSKKLIEEIIELASKCPVGYEKSIQLIMDLRSLPANAVQAPVKSHTFLDWLKRILKRFGLMK